MIRACVLFVGIVIASSAQAAPTGIPLYGPIDEQAAINVSASIADANKEKTNDPIFLVINSSGGGISAGGLIVDSMMASRRPVHTVCASYCASMAAWIHQHGIRRYIFPHAMLMFHQASFGTEDSVPRIIERAKAVQKLAAKFEQIVALNTQLTLEEVQRREANGWWVVAEEAIEEKLADAIVVSTVSKPQTP